jgi:DNA-binding transcriptional regulator YiaG
MPGKNGGQFKYSKPDGSLDVERIQSLIDQYFQQKDTEARRKAYSKLSKEQREATSIEDMTEKGIYTIAGLCVALGISRETLNMWEQGLTAKPKYDEQGNDVSEYHHDLSDVVKKAKTRVLECLEEDRNNKTIMSIFLLKNHAGYADRQEQEITVTGNIRFTMGDLGDLAK